MVFDWATVSPYTGGTVTYVTTYREYKIYFLGHWGLQFYGLVDPSGAELNIFHGSLDWIKGWIDDKIGPEPPADGKETAAPLVFMEMT